MGAKSWLLLLVLVSIGLLLRLLWSGGDAPPVGPVVVPPANAGGAVPAAGEHGDVVTVPAPAERESVASAPDAARPSRVPEAIEVRVVEVFGRVFAKATGAPIAGARVRSLRTSVVTDARGRYETTVELQGRSGLLGAPAPGFFAGLRDLCDSEGIVLILDEIITGFRWHERGAQHVYGIEPDLATFGKGLGNGLRISALVGRRELMQLGGFTQDRDRVFLLSQTAGAQPWALAAMLAVVDVYEREEIAGQLHEMGG